FATQKEKTKHNKFVEKNNASVAEISRVIYEEHQKLFTTLEAKGYFTTNADKSKKKFQEEFDTKVEDAFDTAYKQGQKVSVAGIAEQIYQEETGARIEAIVQDTGKKAYLIKSYNISSTAPGTLDAKSQEKHSKKANKEMAKGLVDFFHNEKSPNFWQKL
ncbi:MAG: hypothetical protein LBU27_09055, partial [Candidatus Peribacteria bacterium]|nr:hypothetical protein [Candidatus Peribacteria bacterium]